MPRNPEVLSINCKSCGAGLEVLGGGRITTHICQYCGSELDAQQNYSILKKQIQPIEIDTPFQLGMTGTIKGIDYTIIGIMQMVENYGWKTWRWVDHYLYSPTHGYAVLTYETGHLTFSRRVRSKFQPLSEEKIESAYNRPSVYFEGHSYPYFETSDEVIEKAVGEFNWRPHIGETRRVFSFADNAYILSYSFNDTEFELEKTEYLDSLVAYSFGVTTDIRPSGAHKLAPFRPSPLLVFASSISLGFAILCWMIMMFISDPGDKIAELQSSTIHLAPVIQSFELSNSEQLIEINLYTNASNSWGWFNATIYDDDDVPVLEVGKEIGFYYGTGWREGSRRGKMYVKLEEPGEYSLELEMEEFELWRSSVTSDKQGAVSYITRVDGSIREGVVTSSWMNGLTGIFALIACLFPIAYFFHHQAKKNLSDWDDD